MLREDLPGWLVYDYRGSNPVFFQLVTPSGHVTRPCMLFVPSASSPRLLVHHVDAGKFADSGLVLEVYSDRQSMIEGLRQMLPSGSRVAMEYSRQGALPRVSKVDAGTVELIGSLGVVVESSADLMQYVTQRWSHEQLEDHRRSAAKLGAIVNEAFSYTGSQLNNGVTEFQVAEFIRRRFREEGLESPDGPIVATNAHSSDPHFEPAAESSSMVRPGDWMLIDLWARSTWPPDRQTHRAAVPSSQVGQGGTPARTPAQAPARLPPSIHAGGGLTQGFDSVYADITWVAYVGDAVPERHLSIFNIVVGARDTAFKFLEDSYSQGLEVQGWQVDDAARSYIGRHGYGGYFTHRLGHSIGPEVHGDAVNLDGFETLDTRRVIPGIGFSIEPGVYLPEFGVRSEIDAYMSESGPVVTSPVQREVVLISEP